MSHGQQAKQALNRLIAQVRNLCRHAGKSEDAVEDKAEALRVWMWASAAGLSLIVVVTVVTSSKANSQINSQTQAGGETSKLWSPAVTEQLPAGFVLVPIEPANLEALDSLFDQHGFVDLYLADGGDRRGRRVARGVALIRSPRNPRRFAVLMPESDSERMPELAEPVLVILRKGPATTAKKESIANFKVKKVNRKADLIEEDQPEMVQLTENGEHYDN